MVPSSAASGADESSQQGADNPPCRVPQLQKTSFLVSYKDKYVVTATIRRDGSSRFSPENRWGWFPSASAAWIISEESFLKNSDFITYLKARVGYGVTGQQDIFSDYPYIPNYVEGNSTAQYQFGNQTFFLTRNHLSVKKM